MEPDGPHRSGWGLRPDAQHLPQGLAVEDARRAALTIGWQAQAPPRSTRGPGHPETPRERSD